MKLATVHNSTISAAVGVRPHSRSTGLRLPWQAVMICLTALLLRCLLLDQQSLSMDEVYDLRLAHTSPGQILWHADGFPPLYHLLLHGWTRLVGGDLAARWLAVLIGTATVLVVYRLGRELVDPATGYAAAALLIVNPFHSYYGVEGRAYTLYILLAAAAILLMYRAMRSNRPLDWIAVAFCSITGIYTHYYFPILIAVLGAWWLLWRRQAMPGATTASGRETRNHEGRRANRSANVAGAPGSGQARALSPQGAPSATAPSPARGLTAFGLIAVAALPALWLLRLDLVHQAAYPESRPLDAASACFTYLSLLTGFSLGPSLRQLHTMPVTEAARSAAPWALALLLTAAPPAYFGVRRLVPRMGLGGLLLLLFAPTLLVGLAGMLGGVGYNVRYLAWLVVPAVLLLAAGVRRCAQSLGGCMTVGALLGICLLGIAQRNWGAQHCNEDIQQLAAYLQSASDPATDIFVCSGYMAMVVEHYLPGDYRVHALADVERGEETLAGALTMLQAAQGRGYYLVYTRPFHGDPAGVLRRRLTADNKIRHVTNFPGAVLYRSRAAGNSE